VRSAAWFNRLLPSTRSLIGRPILHLGSSDVRLPASRMPATV